MPSLLGTARAGIVRERNTVARDELHRHAGHLEIEVPVSRRVEDAPQLTLAGPDAERRCRYPVDGRLRAHLDAARRGVLVVLIAAGEARRDRRALRIGRERGGQRGIVRNVAQHDDPFAQAGDPRNDVRDSLDDDRSGHPVADLPVRETVRVRVIPVQSGRLFAIDPHDVVERLPRPHGRREHVVTGSRGRDREPVKVQIRVGRHPEAARLRKIVLIAHADRIAGSHADRRRDLAALPEERRAPGVIEPADQRERRDTAAAGHLRNRRQIRRVHDAHPRARLRARVRAAGDGAREEQRGQAPYDE